MSNYLTPFAPIIGALVGAIVGLIIGLIEARGLFDHAVAQARYGASVFWVRPGLLIRESLEEFVAYWQIKRDGSRRGIVEVVLWLLTTKNCR